MDIKLFFDPVPETFVDSVVGSNCFGQVVHFLGTKEFSISKMDIALIGLTDFRGIGGELVIDDAPANKIREKLHTLKHGLTSYHIADLGNLRCGVNREETVLRIKEVCSYLMSKKVVPILFGGSHDLDVGQYTSYQGLDKLVSFLNVDGFLDIREDENPFGNHIEQILLHEPNFLFNYSHLAYQSYLIDEKSLNSLEKLYFEAYRVGMIHSNIKDMEPIIREADAVSFDIGAIRGTDAPGTLRPQPFGLTGEEACQLAWYAGLNEKLSSAGFYEYILENDDASYRTASVISIMIWYLIDGFYHRKGELDFRQNDYVKYVVSMPSDPETLIFYKSKLSEKWWMEVPLPEGSNYGRNFLVPCRYEDYKMATDGELPDRYVTTHSRLL